MTNLILGTAQFGSGYGITNKLGRISDNSISEILAVAQEAGIDLFDTAPDYGDAQARLGSLRGTESSPRYVSKFSLADSGEFFVGGETLYASSLADLRVDTLYGLLFHRVADLRDSRATVAWNVLTKARETGVISRIGASIYDPNDLEIVVERFPDLDLIQFPGNLLDRRLLEHPEVHRLHAAGVEVHVRSAYLQGILLAEPERLPQHFAPLQTVLEKIRHDAKERNTTAMGLALGYLKHHPVVDAVLVGATTPDELRSTVDAWTATNAESAISVPDLPQEILDPRLWKL